MFQDLDSTLVQMLHDPAAPIEVRNADVSFETPDKNFAPAQATVDLFLYDVKENRELRDPTPILEKVGTTFIRRPPPVRVDCSYIVTAWSNGAGATRVDQEHRLLGQTLRWLSRFPRIPAPYLQGDLVNGLYPPPTMVAQMDPNKNAGDFWIALGSPPRPAFYLTVTIAMMLGVEEEGPLVTTAITSYLQDREEVSREEWNSIGGTVRSGGGAPVAGAWIRLEPTQQTATTTDEGRFVFTQIRSGRNYTLHVRAAGLGDASRMIEVPSPSGEYDVQFP